MKYVLTDTAVRKLRGVLAPRAGNTGAGGAPTSISPDDFPRPWTVRWAQSELNGHGAWVIWMANTNSADVATGTLVYHGTTALSPDNLIAATTLPAGWYRMYGITGDARSVYLRVVVPEGTDPTIECTLRSSYPPPVANANNYRIKIATMSVDSTTGARRIRQYAASVITISDGEGGGSGSVTLDDVSTDYNGDTEVQIKDWDTGTPESSTTIAQDIHNGNVTAQAAVVSRTTGGVLQYKKLGTLAQLTGSSVNVSSYPIITGVTWDGTNHQLVISSVQVTIANGIITAWNANQHATIETTSISSILGS